MDDYDEAEVERERGRAVIAEGRANVASVVRMVADMKIREPSGEYWRRPEPKPEPAPVQRRLTDAENARWRAYIDGKIAAEVAAALAEVRLQAEASVAATGKALGIVRAQLRQEMADQIASIREALRVEKGHAGGDVIDLPSLPLRGDRRAG